MPGQMTEKEREEFTCKYVTVEGTVVGIDRPPSAGQMLAGTCPRNRQAELGRPSGELVLFTVRPDRWLTADFTDEAGSTVRCPIYSSRCEVLLTIPSSSIRLGT